MEPRQPPTALTQRVAFREKTVAEREMIDASGSSRMLQCSSPTDSVHNSNHAAVNSQENSRRPPWRNRPNESNGRGPRHNQRRETQNNDYRTHNTSDNVGGPRPREAGSGRFRRDRAPRQEDRSGQWQNKRNDAPPGVMGEPSLPTGEVGSCRLQENYNYNRRFQNGYSRRRSNNGYPQKDMRQEMRPLDNREPSEKTNEETGKHVNAENVKGSNSSNYQRTQQSPKKLGERNENWRRPPNRGGYDGNRRPFRRPQWRKEGDGARAPSTPQEQHSERSLVKEECEENVSDRILKERRIVDWPTKTYTKEELSQLRTTEIDLFKKRFPKAKEDTENTFEFTFSPSDPDWPFDVRHIQLKVHFLPNYPLSHLKITVVNPDDILPSLLVEDIDAAIQKWIEFFHKEGQLSFRPFLRWIDRNLQEIFVESLRKIKRLQEKPVVELADPVQSQATTRADDSPDKSAEKAQEHSGDYGGSTTEEEPVLRALPKKHERLVDLDEGFDAVGTSKLEGSVRVAYQGAVGTNQLAKILNNYDPQSAARKGIEIKFRHVDLSESVSFLVCDRLLVSVQCKKCKKIADFQLLPGRRSVTSCAKCQTKLEACFRPCILLQFNPVLGYLELQECTIRDVALSRCHFYADCQGCSKLSPLDGMHMGQRASTNCVSCSVKMQLMVDSIKYMDMCAVEANIKATQMKKANKDSSIQAGKPLPNKGICKHYKKSFRWFRFPCCGKAYPCDDCHNEQETDHTAEFASRMICGFCAKEQPFSNDKPCSQCSNLITGKRTAHWEGGKGCRNKTKMSTNDAKKYTGLNKTVARKNTTAKSK